MAKHKHKSEEPLNPVPVAGVPTIAPGIVAGVDPGKPELKQYKFSILNDLIGRIEGTVEGRSEEHVREFLIKSITWGLTVGPV